MPHGHCYLWEPALLWTQVGANLLIGLAYYSIPIAIWVFVLRRKDLKDLHIKGLFVMFSLFILACGTTHLLDILMIWRPYYWVDSLIRLLTAGLSLATAAVLWPLIPKLLALPSPAQLSTLNTELEAEVRQRRAHEEEVRLLNTQLEQRVAERTHELIQRTHEAELANRSKSSFLATMSHELRTPLNAIIGYSEMMLEDLENGQPTQQQQASDLKQVHASAFHLLALINEVLDLSRIEAEQVEIQTAPLDPAALLEELRQTVQPLALKNRNRLELILPAHEIRLVSDRHRIKQILLNLLGNACKFTHQGLIQLALEQRGEQICMSVKDTGIGNSPEHLEMIFEMFYQADSSYSRKYMGTGLGLTIARGLAFKLSGHIEVESAPQTGTVFRLCLPLEPSGTAQTMTGP